MKEDPDDSPTRTRLLEAATGLMLAKGYAGTSVDEVCSRAKLTKGAFFHHFEDKEHLARALVDKWARDRRTGHERMFGDDPDPLQRVLNYTEEVARRAEDGTLLKGCLMGTFAQELQSVPAIRKSCDQGFEEWIDQLARQIELAKERHAPRAKEDPRALAELFIAHVEGAILLAKASGNPGPIRRAAEAFKSRLKSALYD